VKELNLTIRQFAKRLRRDFAPEIAADPWAFKRKAKHLLGLYLPPGPGRPPEAAVTLATELREKDVSWQEIYPKTIPNHGDLDTFERRCAEYNLRSAVRSRRNAARRRKERKKFMAQGNPA